MTKLHALFIGINDYYYSRIVPPLACAVNDAELGFSTLSLTRDDFNGILLVNGDANHESIRSKIFDMAQDMKEGDSFLLLFAGHGLMGPSKDKTINIGWCLTSEFDGVKDAEKFCPDDIRSWLVEADIPRLKNIVVLLDTCFSGLAVNPQPHSTEVADAQLFRGCRAIPRSSPAIKPELSGGETLPLGPPAAYWPAENVAILSAATGQGLAYEIPHTRRGIFSALVFEWWQKKIAELRSNSNAIIADLDREVRGHIDAVLHSERLEDGRPWSELQSPSSNTQGKVSFGREDHWIYPERDASSALPTPSRPDFPVWEMFPATPPQGVDRYLDRHSKEIHDSLLAPPRSMFDSNILVRSVPRFVSRTVVCSVFLNKVLPKLREQNRPFLYVSSRFTETTLPFTVTLANWSRAHLENPPLVPGEGDLDAFLDYLESKRAVVIVSSWSNDKPSITRLIEGCVLRTGITCCVVVDSQSETPKPMQWRTYKRLVLGAVPCEEFQGEDESVARQLPPESEAIRTPRVTGWLRLRDPETGRLNDNELQDLKDGNELCAVMSIVRDLVERLDGQARKLLDLLCFAKLPVDRRLVHSAWGEENTEALLRTLDSNGLTYEGYVLGDSQQEPLLVPREVVRQVVFEAAEDVAATSCHNRLAKAYQSLGSGGAWPDVMYIHQAVAHYLDASEWVAASEVLINHWGDLLGAGYHRELEHWVLDLKSRVGLYTYGTLLLNLMSLRLHCQQWDLIEEAYLELKGLFDLDRVQSSESNDTKLLVLRGKAYFGAYHIVKRSYDRALSEYSECLDQLVCFAKEKRDLGWFDLIVTCMFRSAECMEYCGNLTTVRKLAEIIGDFIYAVESGKVGVVDASSPGRVLAVLKKKRNQLASLLFRSFRWSERSDEMHVRALDEWTSALRASRGGGGSFSLAISHLHMGWAAFSRREYLRTIWHCLRARGVFNSRGIPEYWWIADNERLLGLSLARLPGGSWFNTSSRSPAGAFLGSEDSMPVDVPHSLEEELTGLVTLQVSYLENLLNWCKQVDPWRACEVESALVQLKYRLGQKNVEDLLLVAEKAYSCGHMMLVGFILELVGAQESARRRLLLDSCEIAASMDMSFLAARRLGQYALFEIASNDRLAKRQAQGYCSAVEKLYAEGLYDGECGIRVERQKAQLREAIAKRSSWGTGASGEPWRSIAGIKATRSSPRPERAECFRYPFRDTLILGPSDSSRFQVITDNVSDQGVRLVVPENDWEAIKALVETGERLYLRQEGEDCGRKLTVAWQLELTGAPSFIDTVRRKKYGNGGILGGRVSDPLSSVAGAERFCELNVNRLMRDY